MRKLVIHREAALCGFAQKYYCYINRDRDAFKDELASIPYPDNIGYEANLWVTNNGTVVMDISEDAGSIFTVLYSENRNIFSDALDYPAGSEDVFIQIDTIIRQYYGTAIQMQLVTD